MYVGITQGLINEVNSLINGMELKERSTLSGENNPPLINGNEEWIQTAIWGEHIHLKNQMPPSWTKKISTVVVDNPVYKGHKLGNIHFPLSPQPFGPIIQEGYYVRENITVKEFPEDALLDKNCKEYLDVRVHHIEIHQRWDKARKDLLDFLQQCKSLNEALKLWPQIEMYIPKHYLTKVNEKREVTKNKSTAAEALKKLDTQALTANAVIARMSDSK